MTITIYYSAQFISYIWMGLLFLTFVNAKSNVLEIDGQKVAAFYKIENGFQLNRQKLEIDDMDSMEEALQALQKLFNDESLTKKCS